MLKKLTPNLMVEDVDRSIEFYGGKLGFQVVVTLPETGTKDFAIISQGDVQLMLQSKTSLQEDIPVVGERSIASTTICYIEVEGVEKLRHHLSDDVDVVVPLRKTFYGMTEFYIRDPDGYVLGFAERVP